jgi:hypothetical protein
MGVYGVGSSSSGSARKCRPSSPVIFFGRPVFSNCRPVNFDARFFAETRINTGLLLLSTRLSQAFFILALYFPLINPVRDEFRATASATTHSRIQRDFPASGKRPRIGGACCRRLVSAKEQLDLRGRFGAFVSGPRNPVSRRRRSLSAETRFESRATAREVRAPHAAATTRLDSYLAFFWAPVRRRLTAFAEDCQFSRNGLAAIAGNELQ